ncbi:MAG: c-type cytochrome [Methyloligellaceae bacterium]
MTFLKVMAFSLVVLLTYTVFANILPQVQSDPPAEEEPVAAGTLDRAGMVAWGERLFSGKGTCTLCHNKLGRAPDLLAMDLKADFAKRLGDAGYEGKAKGKQGAKAIEVYLRESMLEPSAFVVAGFGKKGTNDKVSPMPAANRAPISLSETQINALIAFLQERAGVEVTAPLPAEGEAPAEEEKAEDGDAEEEEGPAKTAQAAIEKFTCNACHNLFGSEADGGPDLRGVGGRLGRDGLRASILKPNEKITKGFEPDIMPQDYAEQMRVRELELIIDFLMTFKKEG